MKRFALLLFAVAVLAAALLLPRWPRSASTPPASQAVSPVAPPAQVSDAGGFGTAQLGGILPSVTADDCCPGAIVQVADTAAPGLIDPPKVTRPASLQPLMDFQGWAERYAAAEPTQKQQLLPEGLRLAGGRQAVMAGLIKYDPKTAIASLLPYALRKGLPPEIASKIEHRVSGRGDLMVLAVQPQPGQAIEEPIVRTARLGETEYRVYTYGKRLADISRTNIPVLGVGVDLTSGQKLLAVREEAYEVLDNSEAADIRAASPVAESVCPISGDTTESKGDETGVDTGGQVVWLCSHGHIGQWLQTPDGELVAAAGGTGSSGGTSPVVPATYTEGNKKVIAIRVRFSDQAGEPASDSSMQTEMQKIVNQWAVWSYGKLQAGFSFTPTLVLPQTEAWYAANGTDNAVLSAARTAAAAYDDGTGAKPYNPANFDFDCVVFSSSLIGNYCGLGYVGGKGAWIKCTNAGTYLHEWGHNLGLWHANYLQPTTDSPLTGTHVEYGNGTSTMGSAGLYPYDTLEKYTLHWLEPADVTTVAASGTYRLYNADKSTLTTAHAYAARIYKEGLVYYVEYRPNWDPSGAHSATTNGVMICWTQQSDQLLDTTPLSSGGSNDASLLVGRSFTDPGQGLTITSVTKGGTSPDDYIDVAINFSQPTTNSLPTAVVAASNLTPATGVSVTLTATASDPDGDALAFSWDFDDGNVSTNNSASQTKSWSTAGDYLVRCTVSDMKGKTVVKSVRIVVGSPSTYTISGRVTKSDGTGVQDVLISDTASHLTYTDSNGSYSLGPVSAGSYTLTAQRAGWTLAAQSVNPVIVGPSAVNINFTATAPAATRSFTLEHWDNIAGTTVANLTSAATYPNSPSYITSLESVLEAQTDNGDNYGQRMRGWFRPPTTGAYTFYISSDDNSELWLSTNDTVAAKVKIASVTGYSNSREWTKFASQKSTAITLTAGQRYYLEALHKEGAGGDNLAVGVDFPGAVQHRPLEVSFVDPTGAVTLPTPANTVTVTATDDSASEAGLDPGTFTLTRSGALDAALSVYFDIGGTATYGSDYQATGLTASFTAGAATTTVTVTPIDDTTSEVNETVVLSISSSLNYTVGAAASATVTIFDNEAPTVTIAATDAAADESGSNPGVFTLTRTGDTTNALTVNLTVGGSATNGSDYPAVSSVFTIPAQQASATITIAPTADGIFEVEETVIFTLAGGAGYTVGTANTATIRIAGAIGTGGGILREWWDNISNTNYVYDLTNLASYPDSPTGREVVTTAFTTVENRADSFGERWRGIFTAPVSGAYRFYVASDDYSELWLSTDATPLKRQKIATVSGSTGFQNWTQFASQKSAAITLVSGQRYYIESIFKEGGGGDHMSVGVEYPNGALERPIPAHRLDPYTAPTALPTGWFSTGIGTTGAVGGAGLTSAPLSAGPKNRYSFNGTASGAITAGQTLTDSVSGATATVLGAGAAFNAAGNAVDLPGGSSTTQAYIDLPNGVVTGTYGGGTRYTSATYETWVTIQTVQNWSRVMDFGTGSVGEVTGPGGSNNGGAAYSDLFLSANSGTSNDQQFTRTGGSGVTGGASRDSSGTTVLNTQVHLAMLYDASTQTWRWYRNGNLMQVIPDTEGLSTFTDVNNWLGRSGYNADSNIDAAYNEFRIYDYALTEAQLRGNYAAGPDQVNTFNSGNSAPIFLSGSGAISTNGIADAFHFAGQTLSGDWDVRARLNGITTTSASALAGLMAREGTAANARHAFIGFSPNAVGHALARLTVGGTTVATDTATLVLPQWVRLVRNGNTIASYVSADGSAWTQVGATATYTSLATSLQIGMVVGSGTTANAAALAQFDSYTISAAPGVGDGFLYERFEGITGGTIAALTSAATYPNSPTLRERREGFFDVAQTVPDLNNFGDRLRGYLVAPQTGNYTFYISGDDQTELWLSPNDSAAARVRIAGNTAYSNYRTWTAFASQKSASIPLVAGQRYYIEALHAEATGGDHVSVGMTLPNGAAEFPILGSRLKAYVPPKSITGTWNVTDIGTPTGVGSSGNFIPGYAGAGDALVLGPRNRYSFSGGANATAADGTTLVDTVSGQHATLRGAGGAFDATGTGISLPGGTSATQAYVDLPTGIVTGKLNGGTAYTNATYELWYTQKTNRNWSRLMDFGTNGSGRITGPGGSFNGTNYVMVTANIDLNPNQRLGRTGSAGATQGLFRDAYGSTVLNQPTHIVMTYDSSAASWVCYRNGVLMSKLPDTLGIAGLDDVNNWLGRSNFAADQNLDGVLLEFRIYNYALSGQQVLGNYNTGPDVVNTVDIPLSKPPRHRWTFSGSASQPALDGTWIYDRIGGSNALVRGTGATFDAAGTGLTLPGGASSAQAYLDLPNGVASGTDNGGTRFTNVTYEAWSKQSAHQQNSVLWSFGTGSAGEVTAPGGTATGTNFSALAANNALTPNPQLRRRGATTDVQANLTGATILNQLTHHVVTYEAAAQRWLWYENGVLVNTLTDTDGVSTLADVNDWLGRSQTTTDANWAGTLREFRIYDYALTADQVLGNYSRGSDTLSVASPGLTGTAAISGGGDIASTGATDSFQFASQTLDGDGEIVARVVSLQNNNTSAKAGVMVRETNATGSRHAFMGITAAGSARYTRRTATGVASINSTIAGTSLPYWMRLVRKGDNITAYTSPDGATWTNQGTTNLSALPADVLVGLAVSSSNTGIADASFDNVQILRPTVNIVASQSAVEYPPRDGVFTLTRTWDTTSSLTVNYTIGGSATAGADYQALSGTITIPVGENSIPLAITPINDSLNEPLETISATVQDISGYVLGSQPSATLTLDGVETASEKWQLANFGSDWSDSTKAGDSADPDGDGLTNLLERALNGNPKVQDASTLMQPSLVSDRLTLSFDRNTTNTDLTITVQGSDSLDGPWTDLARSTAGAAFTPLVGGAGVSETGTGNVRACQIRDLYLTSDPAHVRRYLRVQADHQ